MGNGGGGGGGGCSGCGGCCGSGGGGGVCVSVCLSVWGSTRSKLCVIVYTIYLYSILFYVSTNIYH